MLKKIRMYLFHKIDPDMIDWAYFVVGSEWLTEVLGHIANTLYVKEVR